MSGHEDLNRAIEMMNELGMDDPRTHQAFQSAIDSGDLDDDAAGLAYSMLGSSFHATGEQTRAKKALGQAIKLGTDRSRLAISHHELGETLFVLENEPEAEKHYRKSLELDRQHTFAPDTLALLGRAVYMRSDGNVELLEESYGYFDESLALLESPDGDNYGTFHPRPKALFDATFGKAVCKSEMPGDKQRFEAAQLFESGEELALGNREHITSRELAGLYQSWVAMLERMQLKREAELIAERAARNLNL